MTLHYLCLHVGLGTFKPVYEEHIENQKLHFEPMIISKSIRETIYTAKIETKIFLPI
ncbi:S-adenosylmethionine:tRNA ribosyltransferase-isomerase [bacterium]|nr:S-adenosylmethionine:tRNA ribosyltransferase-isomerase [bacterium]